MEAPVKQNCSNRSRQHRTGMNVGLASARFKSEEARAQRSAKCLSPPRLTIMTNPTLATVSPRQLHPKSPSPNHMTSSQTWSPRKQPPPSPPRQPFDPTRSHQSEVVYPLVPLPLPPSPWDIRVTASTAYDADGIPAVRFAKSSRATLEKQIPRLSPMLRDHLTPENKALEARRFF